MTTSARVARVDMTPMVDLGFLLITFFMFTTSFSSPNMMQLNMPDINGKPPEIAETNTLNLILGKDDRIFWHQKNYKILNADHLQQVSYGKELRQLILQKRRTAIKADYFTVIIHPTDEANYKNAVDILDEMAILNQQRYVLSDIIPREKAAYEAKINLSGH